MYRWAGQQTSSGMASDIPGERRMIDVFSLCGLGGSSMQNSKERNPHSCPSSVQEGLPDPETDRRGNRADQVCTEVKRSFLRQLDEPDIARPGCYRGECSLWGKTQGDKWCLQQLNARAKGELPTPQSHPFFKNNNKNHMRHQFGRNFSQK